MGSLNLFNWTLIALIAAALLFAGFSTKLGITGFLLKGIGAITVIITIFVLIGELNVSKENPNNVSTLTILLPFAVTIFCGLLLFGIGEMCDYLREIGKGK